MSRSLFSFVAKASIQVARNAMATRFEIVLHGNDATVLRAAAEEALDEIQRLDRKLSAYQPDSEISHINARAAHESVRVSPELFRLLEQARDLSQKTAGAFDITVGPLLKLWGFMGAQGSIPDEKELETARALVGIDKVLLNTEGQSVRFTRPGVLVDLGSIGKGYAIDRAVEILQEAGVESALLHGGTSTSYAIGSPSVEGTSEHNATGSWRIAVEYPNSESAELLTVVELRDAALSVSAIWGKSFTEGGTTYGHVIDPRSGQPTQAALLGAVSIEFATESDALSTALLVLGHEGHTRIRELFPAAKLLIASEKGGQRTVESRDFRATTIKR
jgi:thiamine biosynthesis lipoprotein